MFGSVELNKEKGMYRKFMIRIEIGNSSLSLSHNLQ